MRKGGRKKRKKSSEGRRKGGTEGGRERGSVGGREIVLRAQEKVKIQSVVSIEHLSEALAPS